MFEAKAKSEETGDIPRLCHGPCLMVRHEKSEKDDENPLLTFYDVAQKKHGSRISQEVANKHMVASHGDWILVQNDNDESDLCLLNVVTMEELQLPWLPTEHASKLLLSGSPSDADNCTVFVIAMGFPNTIFHCKIGAKQFIMHDMGCEDVLGITVFQGMLYYVNDLYDLYCAQFQDSSPLQFQQCIEWYELDQFKFVGEGYLIGSQDQLLYIGRRTLEIGMLEFEIFGAHLSSKEWIKINNIGSDRAIFIDDIRGFSTHVPPGGPLKGNCIYYISEQSGDDKDLNHSRFYGYHLETGFITMLQPFPFKFPKQPPSSNLFWLDSNFKEHNEGEW